MDNGIKNMLDEQVSKDEDIQCSDYCIVTFYGPERSSCDYCSCEFVKHLECRGSCTSDHYNCIDCSVDEIYKLEMR